MKSTFVVLAFLGAAFAQSTTVDTVVTVATYPPDHKPTDAPGCHKGTCGGRCGDGILQPPEACDLGEAEK